MSTATLNQLYHNLASEVTLKQRFTLIDNGERSVTMTVELSQEKGDNFTSKEVEALPITNCPGGDNGELKDEELEALAGGIFCYSNPSHPWCKK